MFIQDLIVHPPASLGKKIGSLMLLVSAGVNKCVLSLSSPVTAIAKGPSSHNRYNPIVPVPRAFYFLKYILAPQTGANKAHKAALQA